MNELHNFNNGEMDDMKVLYAQVNNMETMIERLIEIVEKQNEMLEQKEGELGELFDMVSENNELLSEQNDKIETFFDEISDPLANRQEKDQEQISKKQNGLLSMFTQIFTRKVQSSVS